MSGETQQQDETEGDGRAWTPPPPHETPETLGDRYSSTVEAVASLEADLDALRRDVASLKPRQQASRPTWLLFAAAGVALTAWVLTPEDPYATALAS